MKILFLGTADSPLIPWLEAQGDTVIQTSDRITTESTEVHEADFVVSYGYRYIIKQNVLDLFPNRAINLHISLLPWNRGADPNLWSFIDDTPKGVSIHSIDAGVDTGDVIAQKEMVFESVKATLATTYAELQNEIQELFKGTWHRIKNGEISGSPQQSSGSYHGKKDRELVEHLLTKGWETPITILAKYGKELRATNAG